MTSLAYVKDAKKWEADFYQVFCPAWPLSVLSKQTDVSCYFLFCRADQDVLTWTI